MYRPLIEDETFDKMKQTTTPSNQPDTDTPKKNAEKKTTTNRHTLILINNKQISYIEKTLPARATSPFFFVFPFLCPFCSFFSSFSLSPHSFQCLVLSFFFFFSVVCLLQSLGKTIIGKKKSDKCCLEFQLSLSPG